MPRKGRMEEGLKAEKEGEGRAEGVGFLFLSLRNFIAKIVGRRLHLRPCVCKTRFCVFLLFRNFLHKPSTPGFSKRCEARLRNTGEENFSQKFLSVNRRTQKRKIRRGKRGAGCLLQKGRLRKLCFWFLGSVHYFFFHFNMKTDFSF